MLCSAAATLARTLMNAHGLGHWVFQFDRAKRRLGVCYFSRRTISLSVHYVRANEEDCIRRTILHEIAHALVGPAAGHGPLWRMKARELGIPAQRCNSTATMPEGRLVAQCSLCQKTFRRHRRPRRRSFCRCDYLFTTPLTWRTTS